MARTARPTPAPVRKLLSELAPDAHQFLVTSGLPGPGTLSGGVFGFGPTSDEAREYYRAKGGNLFAYELWAFPAGLDFERVDDLGNVYWHTSSPTRQRPTHLVIRGKGVEVA